MTITLFSELLSQIKARIYTSKISLPHWRIAEEATAYHDTASFPSRQRGKPYVITTPFGGYDKTVWFSNDITIPREYARRPVVFVADFAEALLHLNGIPFQGIDANHQEVLLTRRARGGERFRLDIQAYCGRGSERPSLSTAFVATLHVEAKSVYEGLRALKDFHDTLQRDSRDVVEVRDHIEAILDLFKGIPPNSPHFDEALQRADSLVRRTAHTVPSRERLHLIAHSHIDVVWLWTLKEVKRKCARTFSTVLRLMDEFPEFTFAQSQALLYQYTKEKYPELYKQIKRFIKQGRWQPVGAMWVEPDCNLANGESLVRHILYGKRFFREEFGIDAREIWLPDTFGYSWALPQIMNKTGIKYFFTTKLTWNDTTRFPHTTFWWEGIDGSRVLAHLPPVGLEGTIAAAHLLKSLKEHRERSATTHVLQTFGYGDGGGGPTREQVHAARSLRAVLPAVTLSGVRTFFDAIEPSQELPVWKDELYLEMHRGTYTTHGWVKKANRNAERSLYETELLSSLAMLAGESYPQDEIEAAWKILLLNQFHDIVPGTAIADAYADVRRDFIALEKTCSALRERALDCFVQRQSASRKANQWSFVIFNSLSFPRSEYVHLTCATHAKRFIVLNDSGKPIPHQVVTRKKGSVSLLCFIEAIPPLSFAQLHVHALSGASSGARIAQWRTRRLNTPFFRIRFGKDGTITSLFDKQLQRELIAPGEKANEFQTFKDTPRQWDAWEIAPDFERHRMRVFSCVRAEVVELGPLRSTVRLMFTAPSGSSIIQDVAFYHAVRRIDFITKVEWHEERTLLKVAFPFAVKTDIATYETQFGAIARPTIPRTPAEKAKYEVPAQQWADMSEEKFGVSLLNDCKYGYDAKGHVLRLSLIRSPHFPHPQEPWWLTDDAVTDQGTHHFTYSLLPHEGDWRAGETTQQARALNHPLIVIEGILKRAVPALVSLSRRNIMVDSIKKAEDDDDLVLRLHEAHGRNTRATLTFAAPLQTIEETDMLESKSVRLASRVSQVPLHFRPFEIKTLKMKRS
jgi:alpha-mannosidase